jgi:hypothetical protein
MSPTELTIGEVYVLRDIPNGALFEDIEPLNKAIFMKVGVHPGLLENRRIVLDLPVADSTLIVGVHFQILPGSEGTIYYRPLDDKVTLISL